MTQDIEVRILEKIGQWEKAEGFLPPAVELYRKVLSIQYEVKSSLVPTPVSNHPFKYRLSQGIPSISFEDLAVTRSEIKAIFAHILAVIEENLTIPNKDMDWLERLALDETLLYQVARDWYDRVSPESTNYDIDSELLATVMQAVLWPWINCRAEALANKLDHTIWRKGYCPVCGGRPDFAYLAEKDGSRWLSCFRCDSEWLFSRMECPYCANTDQKQLSCFIDDRDMYRVYTCHQCQTYLNTIDLRHCNSEVLIPLEKVRTFSVHYQYRDRGFKPGWITNI